jgi:hypothetical protein
VLTLHTFGMMLLTGASSALNLRLLGIAPRIPLASLRALVPMMWVGFWINLITGSLLFASEATTKGSSPTFFVKMAFVVTGVATIRLISREVYGRGDNPPVVTRSARNLAMVSMAAWVAAITAGRLLAYVVT